MDMWTDYINMHEFDCKKHVEWSRLWWVYHQIPVGLNVATVH